MLKDIFKTPVLLNKNVFPELHLKYLKGDSEVNFIDYYHRKHFYGDDQMNIKYNFFCESLWQFKNNSEKDIKIMFEIIKDIFASNFVLITIPSHNPMIIDTGIKKLAKLLIEYNKEIIDGTDFLLRIKEINNHDRKRTLKEQINSMKLRENINIEGKHILIFDDIYTTGNTINAAKYLIEKENPDSIDKLTLGKTYYKNKD